MVGSHLPVTCRGADSHGESAVDPLFFNLPVICRLEEGERVHACSFARSRHLVSMSLVSKMVNFETKLDETGKIGKIAHSESGRACPISWFRLKV